MRGRFASWLSDPFHGDLLTRSRGRLDATDAAVALHGAVRSLRAADPDAVHDWGAWVHTGP